MGAELGIEPGSHKFDRLVCQATDLEAILFEKDPGLRLPYYSAVLLT